MSLRIRPINVLSLGPVANVVFELQLCKKAYGEERKGEEH